MAYVAAHTRLLIPRDALHARAIFAGASFSFAAFVTLSLLVLALSAPFRRGMSADVSAIDVVVQVMVAWILSALLGGFIAAEASGTVRRGVAVLHALLALSVATAAIALLGFAYEALVSLRALELAAASAVVDGPRALMLIAAGSIAAAAAAGIGARYGARRNAESQA